MPAGPRDPVAFRATVLRQAMKIERRRRRARWGAWGVAVVIVALLAAAIPRSSGGRTRVAASPPALISVTPVPWPTGLTPMSLVGGSDGAVWVTASPAAVVRLGADGSQRVIHLPAGATPAGITAGSDGGLWFTDPGRRSVGRVDPGGAVREYATPEPPGSLIVTGADGQMWFIESGAGHLSRVSPAGRVSDVSLPAGVTPIGLAEGPDGGMWFGEVGAGRLGRVSPDGAYSDVPLPNAADRVTAVALGPGPAVWCALADGRLAKLDSGGRIVASPTDGDATGAVTLGPDGRLWAPAAGGTAIVRAGLVGGDRRALSQPVHIDSLATGPDASVWVVDRSAKAVFRLTPP